ARDAVGRVIEIDRPNGTITKYAYGTLDRPIAIQHFQGETLVEAYDYTYDAHGRLTGETTPAGSFQYGYDALNHLATIKRLLGRGDALGERRCLPMPARPDGHDDCAVTYGPGGADPIGYSFGPETFAATHAASGSRYAWSASRGSVTTVTDASGAVVGTRAY